jgi:hypothetical protein
VKAEHICLGHIRDAVSDIRAYASVGEEPSSQTACDRFLARPAPAIAISVEAISRARS